MSESVKTLNCSSAVGQVHWVTDSGEVDVRLENVDSAMWYPSQQLVLCLSGSDAYSTRLTAFDTQGAKIWSVEAPDRFAFSYLTGESSGVLLVVAIGDSKIDGGMDWHFQVDPLTGSLQRTEPAY